MEQVSDGEQLFKQLFDRLYLRMYSLAFRLSDDPHSAQDLTQEAFARLWEAMHKTWPPVRW